ncbi:MAG: phasin family protein [Rhodospirillales bacterium]
MVVVKNGAKAPSGDFNFGKLFDMSNFDMSKQMGEFKFPAIDMEVAAAAQRKNIEALAKANQLAVESMQAIAHRQSEIFRSTMEEASSAARELMAADGPEEKAAKQAEIFKDAFERAVANIREIVELVAKSQADAMGVVHQRVADSLDEIKTVISKTK